MLAGDIACASMSSVAPLLPPPLRSSVVLHAASAAADKSSAARVAALTLVDTRHIGRNTSAKKESARRGPRAASKTDMVRLARAAAEPAATTATAEPAGTC